MTHPMLQISLLVDTFYNANSGADIEGVLKLYMKKLIIKINLLIPSCRFCFLFSDTRLNIL